MLRDKMLCPIIEIVNKIMPFSLPLQHIVALTASPQLLFNMLYAAFFVNFNYELFLDIVEMKENIEQVNERIGQSVISCASIRRELKEKKSNLFIQLEEIEEAITLLNLPTSLEAINKNEKLVQAIEEVKKPKEPKSESLRKMLGINVIYLK